MTLLVKTHHLHEALRLVDVRNLLLDRDVFARFLRHFLHRGRVTVPHNFVGSTRLVLSDLQSQHMITAAKWLTLDS